MSVGEPCVVAGCDRLQTLKSARSMCPGHYKRLQDGREPTAPFKAPNGERQRVLERLSKIETDDCIIWPLSVGRNGYGTWQEPGISTAPVAMLILTVGPRPTPGHDACHGPCISRACVNPRHLRWDTRSANSLDRHRDGTVWQAKLTPEQVYEIRAARAKRTERVMDLAARFGIHVDTVRLIHQRKIWAHLPEKEENQ